MKKTVSLLLLVLSPLGHAQWMSAPNLQDLKLSAPLKKLMHSKKMHPDSKPEVDGILGLGAKNIAVTVKVRGNTNYLAEECPFPKLTLHFKDASIAQTLFAGLKKIKLGTHCGQSFDSKSWYTPLNRIKNQVSVVRESFAYELVRSLDVQTLQTRLIDMTYIDTEDKTQVKKKAMFLEDDLDMALRTQTKLLKFSDASMEGPVTTKLPLFSDAVSMNMDLTRAAEALLMEALLGNHDSSLRISRNDQTFAGGPSLYNMFVLKNEKNGVTYPVPYDFDVASAVNGRSSLEGEAPNLNLSILGGIDLIQYSILRRVQEIKAQIPTANMGRAITKIIMNKARAYSALSNHPMDAEGKDRFKRMMDFFFLAITQYYDLPRVSSAKGFQIYHDQELKSVCGKLPRGSVYIVIAQKGPTRQVQPILLGPDDSEACFGKGPFWEPVSLF